VITGLIKANVPTRIALKVASQVDSRTILDSPGAEKLVGGGDMLYLSSKLPTPQRVQGVFVSEQEVKRVIDFIREQAQQWESSDTTEFVQPTTSSTAGSSFDGGGSSEGDYEDELYEEARDIVMRAGKASTSMLQRRLRIGYSRAARLIDMLEEYGVVGPADGSKPREVLQSTDDAEDESDDER
jgi:S-DNA-T family DNA segregation ATPase FtsK/SpoIIIE